VLSGEFPAGTTVDLPDGRRPSGWQVAIRLGDGVRVDTVEVADPGAPHLWYVEVAEPTAVPAATSLMAFSDDRQADGRVLGAAEARAAGIGGAGQVAAVRWWPGTGLVHQVYVDARHRGRGVARTLVQVAYALQAVRGLPLVHGDGRRTELGEGWRQALPAALAAQLAPLSEVLPPMTPAG
jgi:GNAT superfamily N-acetyltransferase